MVMAFYPQIYVFFNSGKGKKLVDKEMEGYLENLKENYSKLEYSSLIYLSFSVSYIFFFISALTFPLGYYLITN